MAQWKNKEEYEKWKAEKTKAGKSEPPTEKDSPSTKSGIKKCPYCLSEINIRDSICPSCKKKVGKADKSGIGKKHYSLGTLIFIVIIGLLLFGIIMSSLNNSKSTKSASGIEEVPTFKVVGQDKSALSILVTENITIPQLKTLLYEFRKAYKEHTLSKMIPPTTQGGVKGNYAIVWIFVFSDSEWATESKLRRFINSSNKSISDREFDREYASHIKAECYFTEFNEYGNVGYNDGSVHSENYEKLF